MGILNRTLALVLVLVGHTATAVPEPSRPEPILLLVSLDGFRWDYLGGSETPNLQRLAAAGVRAEGLIPVFPSKTFPSHYSIATGLYPGHHGIVSNNMRDPELGTEFHLHDRQAVEDPRWWGGEPIWVTAEKQGVTAATLFWPGSETTVAGVRPSYWFRFDRTMSFPKRVAQVFEWLDLPTSERPRFISLYFELPNDVAHRYGPDASETRASLRQVDAEVGRLMAGIERRGLGDTVQWIVVSDHGMAAVSPARVVYLDDYVDLREGELFEDGAVVQIYPETGREESIYEALDGVDPHLVVYRRSAIPERYHLRDSPRAPPILGVPDVGWEVTCHDSPRVQQIPQLRGDHGQDPADPRMHGIFIAKGSMFQRGRIVERFENVDVYILMAAVLGLEPAPNDGDPAVLSRILARDDRRSD